MAEEQHDDAVPEVKEDLGGEVSLSCFLSFLTASISIFVWL
jgi:hypothetical protein